MKSFKTFIDEAFDKNKKEIATFKIGDKVKVVANHGNMNGKEGEIVAGGATQKMGNYSYRKWVVEVGDRFGTHKLRVSQADIKKTST